MTLDTASSAARQDDTECVKVWDLFVRLFHWTVVVAFFAAYVTEDDLMTLHVWAGYTVGGAVVLRVLWGFVGPRHARFSDFIYRPAKVWAYALRLASFRAERYLGHSPAGGAMILALLIALAAAVWSGLELYAVEENAGPLAAVYSTPTPSAASADGRLRLVSEDDERRDDKHGSDGGGSELWEELHEALAHLTFVLVLLHIGGVVLASVVHRENLVRAMVTGRKRRDH